MYDVGDANLMTRCPPTADSDGNSTAIEKLEGKMTLTNVPKHSWHSKILELDVRESGQVGCIVAFKARSRTEGTKVLLTRSPSCARLGEHSKSEY